MSNPSGKAIEMPANFRDLDASGATADEMAEYYGVSSKTIKRWRKKTRPAYLSREHGSYRMSGRTQ